MARAGPRNIEHAILVGGPARREIVDVTPKMAEVIIPDGPPVERRLRGARFVRTAERDETGLAVYRFRARQV